MPWPPLGPAGSAITTGRAWTAVGQGTFRPGPGAHPTIGRSGEISEVVEARIEMVVPPAVRARVVSALRQAHPYEEPAFELIPTVATAE